MNVDVFATLGEKWLGQFVILLSPKQIKTWSDWGFMQASDGGKSTTPEKPANDEKEGVYTPSR